VKSEKNMTVVEKKIWPEFFELVKNRKKRFEFRLADFECKEGDTLVLKEWDPKTKDYTGRELKRKVGFLMKTKELKFHTPEEKEKFGFYVIQLE